MPSEPGSDQVVAAEPTATLSAGETGEMRSERRTAQAQHEGEAAQRSGALEMKTVAERAVDRVTHGIKLGKAIPAGF